MDAVEKRCREIRILSAGLNPSSSIPFIIVTSKAHEGVLTRSRKRSTARWRSSGSTRCSPGLIGKDICPINLADAIWLDGTGEAAIPRQVQSPIIFTHFTPLLQGSGCIRPFDPSGGGLCLSLCGHAIGNRLGQMNAPHMFGGFEIGECSRHLQHPVIGAG